MSDLVTPKFKVGDSVWVASPEKSETFFQCTDCLGSREWFVVMPNGEGFKVGCETCRRGFEVTGKLSNYKFKPNAFQMTVGSVQTNTADEDRPVMYMMVETGVGSGRCYNEADCFLTEFEAHQRSEEECLRRELHQDKEFRRRCDYAHKETKRKPEWKDKRINALEKEIKRLNKLLAAEGEDG